MNVVDSSGWLEYFFNHPNAGFFRAAIEDTEDLIVPTIAIYEVYRAVLRERGDEQAGIYAAVMSQGNVVSLDQGLAVSAADLAHGEKLAMADAIILATARFFEATLWTQDGDLAPFEGVKFRAKQ